ncbi:hemophore-related protein [Mycobacterium sp. 1274761.0]|uniref:hemophore-related protein n=1 Tax=Mycobacterium sp. 1274761.0 TaxID=1834077 RepID=UPI001E4FCE44|nr:hemophore-related protein [Mycobacterium sp. 1274761.0]
MWRNLGVAVVAMGSALTSGAGAATAETDMTSFINTTCTYSQMKAALNAIAPDRGAEFAAAPMAQTWMHAFLDSPVEQRRQLIQQAPQVMQYDDLVVASANTCKNFPA